MTVEEYRMPYTEYHIYYTNSKLGYKNQELYAQTLESTKFFSRPNRSYGYYTSKNEPVLNPTAENSPVPLAPWFPFDGSDISAKRWGLNVSTIENLLSYLKPGLKISTYSSTKASDIALAGTRPVQTNDFTSTVSPALFYPDVEGSGITTIDIVIYVSRVYREDGSSFPKLNIERQSFTTNSSSALTLYSVSTIHSKEIPDVPYFVFNFAVCAPGAPSSGVTHSKLGYSITPGGGSGAGAQFTAILSTNSVSLTTPEQIHTDKITIRYTLAKHLDKQSYSSSSAVFNPSSGFSKSDNGIDVVKVKADLHYTRVSAGNTLHYPYSRKCTLPGGLIYPGLASYSTNAVAIINNFINNKDKSELVSSTFDNVDASVASALIFHKANWMLPEQDNLFNEIDKKPDLLPQYQLSQPFTVFNPEALFPGSSLTKIGTSPYTGAAGRPSILNDGASPFQAVLPSDEYTAEPGVLGAGASGASWKNSDGTPKVTTADGGPFTIVLSW